MANDLILSRVKKVLTAEAEAIAAVNVTPAFEQAVLAMQECQGKIVTTGIGKAGLVARKFAVTLNSVATVAVFMHPSEAAHGDLGVLGEGDVMVAFSTSGKSAEVLEAIELARHHLGLARVIGITSHVDSALRDSSDIVIDMGIIEEPCPLKMTPSASIAVMLAISDALALSLMELDNVSVEDYGIRHHGGYLGRKARADNLP